MHTLNKDPSLVLLSRHLYTDIHRMSGLSPQTVIRKMFVLKYFVAWGNHKRKFYTVGQENMEEVDAFTALGYMGIAIGKTFELLNCVYLLLKTFNAGLKLTINNFPTTIIGNQKVAKILN